MKLKMNTNILPLIDPGLYGTILGSHFENVPECDLKDFEELLCEKGKEIMNEILQDELLDFGEMKIDNVTFHHPRFYNYENDWFEFEIEFSNDIIQKIINELDDDFYRYIRKRFGTRDGFISFMPYTKEKYLEAIHGKDLTRSIAMYMTYIIECKCYDMEIYQRDFEDEMFEVSAINVWDGDDY